MRCRSDRVLISDEFTNPIKRRIMVGTYRANYKARGALEKLGYRECANSEEVLRTYYSIPEDRLRTSVAFEKLR